MERILLELDIRGEELKSAEIKGYRAEDSTPKSEQIVNLTSELIRSAMKVLIYGRDREQKAYDRVIEMMDTRLETMLEIPQESHTEAELRLMITPEGLIQTGSLDEYADDFIVEMYKLLQWKIKTMIDNLAPEFSEILVKHGKAEVVTEKPEDLEVFDNFLDQLFRGVSGFDRKSGKFIKDNDDENNADTDDEDDDD